MQEEQVPAQEENLRVVQAEKLAPLAVIYTAMQNFRKKKNNIYTNGHWSMFSIFLGLPENSLRVHLASSTDVGG